METLVWPGAIASAIEVALETIIVSKHHDEESLHHCYQS
jgi:hypothetical protein